MSVPGTTTAIEVWGATLIYDAGTTHGGSGGPLLDVNDHVVAIDSAIIARFGGSNIGTPAEHARRLLDTADAARSGAASMSCRRVRG